MRYSALGSAALLLCLGCARLSYPGRTAVAGDASALRALQPKFTTTLYRTQIDVVGKHLSGLLFFKKQPDESFRVVFTNEMGLNFFDFRFADHQFTVEHCIDQLNKKAVINQLHKDIGFVLMTDLDYAQGKVFVQDQQRFYTFASSKETTTYVTDAATREISRIENASARKEKVLVTLKGRTGGMPDSVFIDHKLFPFTIALKQIAR
ncbi:hypothetical protein MON38_03080 [Hymenobacter sp. DH14]|uniref:DUF4292 domain-containing protein n=1 Tax=Hymenobacter cyanobacteriorum TaxID=2926463 RepID=A0A9X1VD38_9BACT|nr:hypothetical protein [Hymenobacter cyanobacteriorum]MCI1186388.1 hypothetical protein [Hymenobacter cyanobacteriorum]